MSGLICDDAVERPHSVAPARKPWISAALGHPYFRVMGLPLLEQGFSSIRRLQPYSAIPTPLRTQGPFKGIQRSTADRMAYWNALKHRYFATATQFGVSA